MSNRTLTIKNYLEVKLDELTDITVVYCRLSQDDGSMGDSNSIINQKKILEEVVTKEHLSNPVYFIDDGISGTTIEHRPAISKAIALVEMGKVKNFIVKDLSRLARNYLDAGKLTEITFPAYDVRFIAVNDGVDSDYQTDNDANILPLKSLFNDWFARDTSKKIKAVKQAQAKAGERMTTIPVYGYKRDPDNSKNWLVDPLAAEVIRRIFSEMKSGKTIESIRRWLCADKIETPSYRRITLGDKPAHKSYDRYGWHPSMINKILSRPEYLGHTVNFRTYRKSYKDKKQRWNPPEKWQIVENTHPAIIDQESYDIVQKMLEHNRVQSKKRRYNDGNHENIFAGLVFCGTCGHKHYFCARQTGNSNADHYKCSRFSKVNNRCVNAHFVSKGVLVKIVLSELNTLLETIHFNEGAFLDRMEQKFKLETTKNLNAQRQKLLQDKKRIEEIDSIIQRLYEDNLSGKLTDKRFIKMNQAYEAEQTELATGVTMLNTLITEQEQSSLDLKKFMKRIKKYTKIETLTTEIANELIDRIIVGRPDGRGKNRKQDITIHYNFIGTLNEKSE
ncbi:recombinase family protein [Candidatus Saccharibacteria bacterium]|nr:recombinase family protein [Candidatus Saccharibacteria bacterium]